MEKIEKKNSTSSSPVKLKHFLSNKDSVFILFYEIHHSFSTMFSTFYRKMQKNPIQTGSKMFFLVRIEKCESYKNTGLKRWENSRVDGDNFSDILFPSPSTHVGPVHDTLF